MMEEFKDSILTSRLQVNWCNYAMSLKSDPYNTIIPGPVGNRKVGSLLSTPPFLYRGHSL